MSRHSPFSGLRSRLVRAAAAIALVASTALPAHAGGPLALVNNQPVVYPNGGAFITLNLDQGPLGTRTNAQATAIVQNSIAMWNGVSTSTMRLIIGVPLSTDYTASNYTGVYQKFSDGLNPIIFDTNGSITDALFGVGAKSSILGFAGSSYYTSGPSAGKYREGQAIINGYISISDATLTEVFAHEIGHFFGLDHSQLDSTQGLASSNYVLMYPIAYRTLPTLHEDDVAAVTSLYPAANVASTYGQLTGAFTTAGGTPILGANIWAKEVGTGKVYSVVSDFLTQGNGYFRLYLPAGTYTLNAESIASNFTGGSRVGPHSNTSSSASFQAPHPIAPIALGGGLGQPIVISAGCMATASFRLDGTGSVSGNCSGSTPTSTTTTLTTSGSPATVGSTVTWTATVAGAAPTGTVNFKNGGTTITGCGAVALSGVGNSRTALCSSSALVVGVHSIVATYSGDPANAASTSNTLSQVINPAGGGSSNVALASAGAAASASSAYSASYAVSGINNNERTGANWGNGNAGWNDATPNAWPDWVQLDFNGSKTIDRVVVYSVQDNYTNPVEPTDAMTFSLYGLQDFIVQAWNGSAWYPLATITNNNLVKRSVSFTAVTTDRIRIHVTRALNTWSRITEVEAWSAAGGGGPAPTTTTLTTSGSPAVVGTTVTFTATVMGTNPTGSVNFTEGGTSLCSNVALTGGGNNPTASCSTSSLAVGTHSIVATYSGDPANAASTSNTLSQVINPAGGGSSNVALASAGAAASASSAYSASYAVSGINNNERTGANWGNGNAGWNDATPNAWPDWVQLDFNGSKTIDRVVVYSVQDNYTNPVEPTDAMTFSLYGLQDFIVQAWNGSAWYPLATITNNNLVKRSVSFTAVTTDRIRIHVTRALNTWSRLTEVEVWGT